MNPMCSWHGSGNDFASTSDIRRTAAPNETILLMGDEFHHEVEMQGQALNACYCSLAGVPTRTWLLRQSVNIQAAAIPSQNEWRSHW
mmetsp:Transcript_2727/g.6833  ORF Transcript_2727/g.6833 Transcript_2727/m.6833 type:complete len:87 (+) Transcript_2727:553-813(+)